MAVTAKWYGNGLLGQFSSTAARRVDWGADTIKMALCTSSYTPNQDTHTFYSDLTNEVANGNGYTTGGVTLGTCTSSYDATSNETRLTSAAASWSSATFTSRYGVIYKSTGTGSTSPLLGYIDFGADETVASGTYTVTADATHGWLYVTAA